MKNQFRFKKYESALKIILFCVECNPKVNLNQLRKEFKINKNFITALHKLKIIQNVGNKGCSNYMLLKKFTPEMTIEVLNHANKLSKNVKKEIEEKKIATVEVQKQSFFNRIFNFKF
jgi:hypothetical protein